MPHCVFAIEYFIIVITQTASKVLGFIAFNIKKDFLYNGQLFPFVVNKKLDINIINMKRIAKAELPVLLYLL